MLKSFSGRLNLTIGIFMATILSLAALFYASSLRYQDQLEIVTVASGSLASYQAVSHHAFRKLNAVSEIVASRDLGDVEARLTNEELLRDALNDTRSALNRERAFGNPDQTEIKAKRLQEIEDIVGRIIQGGGAIRDEISKPSPGNADRELAILRSAAVTGRFNDLIDAALQDERALVQAATAEAVELSRLITQIVFLAGILTVLFSLTVAYRFSSALSKSLGRLAEAVTAYTSGNLAHRTPKLPESEFNNLGLAFNEMATELADQRKQVERAQASLESEVQLRTAELKQTLEELEKVDQQRRHLLADISHEIRTPLTLIRGEADIALRGSDKAVADYKDALTLVRDQAIQTTRLVKDLLFIAKAEAGKPRLSKNIVSIETVASDAVKDFRSALQHKSIDLIEHYEPDTLWVEADAGRLRQVFAILLDNAIRHSNYGGKVTIRTDQHPDTNDSSHPTAVITITDQGAGIASEELQQVFTRFYRGQDAARYGEGSGLGLPVAKAIIEAHQGQIMLRSTEGEGTVAEVRIPLITELTELQRSQSA